jgi:hypothetical protein
LHFISGEEEMTFYIQSVHSRKYLDVKGINKEKGTKVQIYDFHGGKNQQWSYKEGKIISSLNGCVIYEIKTFLSHSQLHFPQLDPIFEAE